MDPLAAKAVAITAGEASTVASGLVARVLGPSADEIGVALRGWVQRRLTNTENIARAAERKGATRKDGEVNPRVAHKVLGEGSLFDGELAAEYFGGMLAGSKTADGREDSAVAWATMVASMSSPQIRLHFVMYREWARLLKGQADVPLGMGEGRNRAKLWCTLVDALNVMHPIVEDPTASRLFGALEHATVGLERLGLVSNYGWGTRSASGPLRDSPYEQVFTLTPSAAGFELYGWAQGVGGLHSSAFASEAIDFQPEE